MGSPHTLRAWSIGMFCCLWRCSTATLSGASMALLNTNQWSLNRPSLVGLEFCPLSFVFGLLALAHGATVHWLFPGSCPGPATAVGGVISPPPASGSVKNPISKHRQRLRQGLARINAERECLCEVQTQGCVAAPNCGPDVSLSSDPGGCSGVSFGLQTHSTCPSNIRGDNNQGKGGIKVLTAVTKRLYFPFSMVCLWPPRLQFLGFSCSDFLQT